MKQWRGIAPMALLATFAAAPASIAGRPVDVWEPDRLWKRADVVVMATAESSASRDLEHAKDDTWVPVRTTFSVDALLKGRVAGRHVTVDHFRYQSRRAEISVIDGPAFVKFDTSGRGAYLMFLKLSPSGRGEAPRLEPVSGQMDPGFSFRRMLPIGN